MDLQRVEKDLEVEVCPCCCVVVESFEVPVIWMKMNDINS
jgi:hypothetical protein